MGIINLLTRSAVSQRDHGEVAVNAAGIVSVTAGNFVRPGGSTALGSSKNFSSPVSFRLQYTGSTTKTFLARASYTLRSGTNSRTARIRLNTSGTALGASSEQQIRFQNAARELQGSVMSLFQLQTGQYVQIEICSESGATNLTMEFLNLILTEV